jgi:hypothetical protein
MWREVVVDWHYSVLSLEVLKKPRDTSVRIVGTGTRLVAGTSRKQSDLWCKNIVTHEDQLEDQAIDGNNRFWSPNEWHDRIWGVYEEVLLLGYNKKFWEELIAYFTWYDTGHIDNDASNGSSIVACVFVTAVTFLQSRCRATIAGIYIPEDRTDDTISFGDNVSFYKGRDDNIKPSDCNLTLWSLTAI